jgi:hypothetical protein
VCAESENEWRKLFDSVYTDKGGADSSSDWFDEYWSAATATPTPGGEGQGQGQSKARIAYESDDDDSDAEVSLTAQQ